MDKLSVLRLPAALLSPCVFFVAVRYLDGSMALQMTGLFLLLFAIFLTYLLSLKAKKSSYHLQAKAFLSLLLWKGLLFLSFLSYMAYELSLPNSSALAESFLSKAFLAGFVSLPILALFLGIGLETSLQKAGSGIHTDFSRIKRSGVSWLSAGLLLTSLIAINYFTAKKDQVFDLSYFKTTKPSQGSLAMVHTLTEPLEIMVFYPIDNEVRPLVGEYFSTLAQKEKLIALSFYDKDLDPNIAKEHKISQNGQVIMRYDGRSERLNIGLTRKRARKILSKLDATFQKSFSKLVAKPKIAYFTTGHGEMSPSGGQKSPLRRTKGLSLILKSQNFSVKYLEGKTPLVSGVPDDATLVVVAGPTRAFLEREVDVLKEYFEKGGSLVILLDDDLEDKNALLKADGFPLHKMLEEYGILYKKERLASSKHFVSSSKSRVDRWFLYSNIFSSHKASENLSKNDTKIQTLFFKSGHLELKNMPGMKVTPIIKAFDTTFADKNRNFVQDKEEKKKSYIFTAVAEKKPSSPSGRIFVSADASVFSDFLLNNVGNQVMVLDTFRFASGDEAIAAGQESHEDVKIIHSQDKHLAVFYGSVFLMPSLVLFGGFLATRRLRFERNEDA